MGRGEVHARFWWCNPRERHNLEDLEVDGMNIFKMVK
jgi:hypothetical protein